MHYILLNTEQLIKTSCFVKAHKWMSLKFAILFNHASTILTPLFLEIKENMYSVCNNTLPRKKKHSQNGEKQTYNLINKDD